MKIEQINGIYQTLKLLAILFILKYYAQIKIFKYVKDNIRTVFI